MKTKDKAKSVESPGTILVEAGIFIVVLLSALELLSLI